ncbi:MAG TPA: DUF1003 domain-containing protein [Caulobacteraceae bacterium]
MASNAKAAPAEVSGAKERTAGSPKSYYRERQESLSPLNKLAVWITDRVGTMGFFLIIFAWTVIWLGWNLIAPAKARFDPPMGFVFYLFISNVIQILLMPLIMVGQNVQGAHAEARATYDLNVNVKAENEIETILKHLAHQNDLLIQLVETICVAPTGAPVKDDKKGA